VTQGPVGVHRQLYGMWDINKKFWEELIAYFPLIRYRPHRKRRLRQLFVATGTCLRNHCLATIGRITHRPTDSLLWYDTGRIGDDASKNSSIVCVLVAAVTFISIRWLATIWGYTYRHTDWWKLFMKYAVEMDYILSFINIGSDIQKLMGGWDI
jgi:hypothetical protein